MMLLVKQSFLISYEAFKERNTATKISAENEQAIDHLQKEVTLYLLLSTTNPILMPLQEDPGPAAYR